MDILIAALTVWTGFGFAILFFMAEEKHFNFNWRVAVLCGPILTPAFFLIGGGLIMMRKLAVWARKS
jgi:hypothetical protein